MIAPVVMTEFEYSRVYAQGWNAARADALAPQNRKLNPYTQDPQRARWQQGFAAAQG
jgi:hypothetical protein